MTAAGHQVTPFALAYEKNRPAPAAGFFPPPPVDGEFVQHGDRALSLREKLRLAHKVIHDPVVYRAATEVIQREKIEVVLTLQIAHYLYPEVLLAARDQAVPVVMRLSDYQLVCPAYNCLRDGRPCFACRRSLLPALLHRCLKKSLPITAARVLAMRRARRIGAHRAVHRYLCPSRHLIDILRQAGFATEQLLHLPTPLAAPPDPGPPPADGPLLFVGGLYEAKGAHLAVEAVRGTGRKLIIAGDAETPYGRALRERVAQEGIGEVTFAGFIDGDRLAALYAVALAVVIPSLWWENVPHTALEAMAHRRPVLAAGHGSLPEVVRDGVTGLLFTPGDAGALRNCLARLDEPGLVDRLGRAGRAQVLEHHAPDTHFRRLTEILEESRR